MDRVLIASLSVLCATACALPHAAVRGESPADASSQPDSQSQPDVVVAQPDVLSQPDAEACPAGQTRCGDRCVDTRGDSLNCGACGRPCAAGQLCANGQCATDCGSQTLCAGACVDVSSNAMHCGGCGRACTAGQECAGSTCRCPAALPNSCGDRCVNLQTDSNNCGACGRVCASTTGGTSACVMGNCTASCPAGTHLCGTSCVSDSSIEQCGPMCTRCTAPAANGAVACQSDRCVTTCNMGYMPTGFNCVAVNTNCGNGMLDSSEQCDDRNAMSGDGCSSSCQLEANVLTEQCSSTRAPLQISLNQTIRLRASTASATSETNACNGMNRALGPDVVFELRLREAGRVRTTVTPGSRWDIILKGGTMCPGECLDDNNAGNAEGPVMTTGTIPAGTTFYLIVDGYSAGDSGDFTLETSLVP
ncbi:MAG: hypothetical protein U0269_24735 [Polyangiales bacterium]